MSKIKLLFLILIFGFALRAYKITSQPLYGDELTGVYDSYSLLKVGKDQTGQPFPLTFSMRGGSLPGYTYLSLIPVYIFGPTALGDRSVSLFAGTLIILLTFLIAKKLFTENIGIISAFFTAISPWALNLSRGGFETNLALMFVLLGVVSFLYSEKKPYFLIFGAISFCLAMFTYQTYKLLVPVFMLLTVWYLGGINYFTSKTLKKYSFISIGILSLFIAVLVLQSFSNNSERRFNESQNSIREVITQTINYDREIAGSSAISKFFHNKYVEHFILLRNSYLKFYSLDFLFINGDGNPRHNMTQTGELYFADFVLIIAFLLFIIRRGSRKEHKFILGWIIISPIAASLLGETHALRASLMMPALIIICSIGLVSLISKYKLFFLSLIFLVQFLFLIEKLYVVSPVKFARFWSGGARDAVEIAEDRKDNYDQIIISNKIDNIEYAYPVYAQVDPSIVIAQFNSIDKHFGKAVITDIKKIDTSKISKKTLIISEPDLLDQPLVVRELGNR